VGHPGRASRSTKSSVDQILALHREMNPVPGMPVIVAIDQSSGQLFICAAKGTIAARLEGMVSSGERTLREEWQQHRA
jgi:hypothetical protein